MYLDRNEFHKEMTKCKKEDKLSDKAVGMLKIFAENISRKYYFEDEDDRQDAIAHAMMDFVLYWKNFKEVSLVKIAFVGSLSDGDTIEIKLANLDPVIYKAVKENADILYREFNVSDMEKKSDVYKRNKTMDNFKLVVNTREQNKIEVSIDKVKSVITIMDRYNSIENSIEGYVKININNERNIKELFADTRSTPVPQNLTWNFVPPNNSFSYFSSLLGNAVIKSLNKTRPAELRNGKKISIDSIIHDGENQNMFNI